MGVYVKGNRWYTDLYDYDGKRIRQVVHIERKHPSKVTRQDALIVGAIRKADLARGVDINANSKNPKFEMLIRRYLLWVDENHKYPATDHSICKTLLNYFKDHKVKSINLWKVEQFKSFRKKQGRSEETINKDLGALRRIMNLSLEWGLISKNPIQGIKLLKVPVRKYRTYKPWEFSKLYNSAPGHFKPILVFAYLTGCRNSEITNLKWNHIDFENEEITINKSKNNEYRTIPLHVELKTLLFELKNQSDSEYVFVTPKGTPYKSNTPWKSAWKKTLKKSGIEQGRFYDLRHTFVTTLMVEEKEDFPTVMSISGHKDIKMLKRYSHTNRQAKKIAINKLRLELSNKNNAEEKRIIEITQ